MHKYLKNISISLLSLTLLIQPVMASTPCDMAEQEAHTYQKANTPETWSGWAWRHVNMVKEFGVYDLILFNGAIMNLVRNEVAGLVYGGYIAFVNGFHTGRANARAARLAREQAANN